MRGEKMKINKIKKLKKVGDPPIINIDLYYRVGELIDTVNALASIVRKLERKGKK